nr:PREDICTED: phytanoyl-CoA dioxygenase domain-containing protein 1 homolog [Bemisia tabaci]
MSFFYFPEMGDSDLKRKFFSDGFLVIEDFFNDEEVTELKKAGLELTQNALSESKKTVFNTINLEQNKETYFLESSDKISYFFEEGALGENGELLVDVSKSLNKVAHALHWLHPIFRQATFHPKVKQLSSEIGLVEPRVVQSMYIYKNPGLGSEVISHQDATYLYTEPQQLYGFWFPLEDATIENGCLWFIPGSHKSGVHRRYIRNPDKSSNELLINDKPTPHYPASAFRAVPVKKGACVLIHGQVVHRSEHNRSDKSRHAYTFHIHDAHQSQWSPENWLQIDNEFPLLYAN